MTRRFRDLIGRQLDGVTESRHWMDGHRRGDADSLVHVWLHFARALPIRLHVSGETLIVSIDDPGHNVDIDQYGEIQVGLARPPDLLAGFIGQRLTQVTVFRGYSTEPHCGGLRLDFDGTALVIGAFAGAWVLAHGTVPQHLAPYWSRPVPAHSTMLDRFPALFPDAADGGTLTAGNSCRDDDGAAAVAVVPARTRGGTPGLTLLRSATVGCDPALPGVGPVPAVERLLANSGVDLVAVAVIEIVEAFAAQALATLTRFGLATADEVDTRVCAAGGALARGHPWGASAAVGVVRLVSRLVRSGAPAGTLGLATAAGGGGGGIGVAALFEVVR